MTNKLTTEQLELLKKIESYLSPQEFVTLEYTPPAQCLRNQADAIEAKEQDLQEFRNLISKLGK